jgi:polysaccharide deacetylase family protein (PEP-CTERM system associated)
MHRAAPLAAPARIQLRPVPLTPPPAGAPVHAFTVDVEDWYQSTIDYDAPISERVVRNTDRILELLDDAGIRGTFFVQGRVAETFPHMVAGLVAAGHEVQSHGHSHRPLFEMDRHALREELERAKATVEDAAGTPVTAFRAQDFSILATNLWAIEALVDVGFTVDSSVFPIRGPRYGIRGWPVAPHRLSVNGASLLEAPVAVWARGPVRLPVAGGGYFRVLPRGALERAISSIGDSGRPAIVYCHPYEFAPGELAGHPELGWRLRRSQGLGRGAFAARMRALLRRLSFGPLGEVLEAWRAQ